MTPSTALPDVRDGLPLLHRRVLLAMHRAGIGPAAPHRSSADIVRDVNEVFRPRARGSAYDALISMVQPFACRYPLLEGQGNFGSIEGDPPAAAAYTEARLTPIATALLADTDGDDRSFEPAALGGGLPNLIVNGASCNNPNTGTTMVPHNLREVVDATICLIDQPDATAAELRRVLHGPDFPTGGSIQGLDGVREYLDSGRGRFTLRAHAEIGHDHPSRQTEIVITELPYGVGVAALIAQIAEVVRSARISGITYLSNESRLGSPRIAMLVRDGTSAELVLKQLYEQTAMQKTVDVEMTTLVPHSTKRLLTPATLSLKQLLVQFIAHRDAVLSRRIDARARRMALMKEELARIAEAYGDDRRTRIA